MSIDTQTLGIIKVSANEAYRALEETVGQVKRQVAAKSRGLLSDLSNLNSSSAVKVESCDLSNINSSILPVKFQVESCDLSNINSNVLPIRFQSYVKEELHKVQVVFENFQSQMAILCELKYYITEIGLDKPVYEIFKKRKNVENFNGTVGFDKYIDMMNRMEVLLGLREIAGLIWGLEIDALVMLFWTKLKPVEYFDGFDEGVVNWIPVNKVLVKILVLEEEFIRHAKLSEEELWIAQDMISGILKKLEIVKRTIFNKRDWNAEESKDFTIYSESIEHLVCFIERSSWAKKDLKYDPTYLTPDALNQRSFRNICQKVFNNYKLIKIQSDGNCFFRSVVRYFCETCPQPVEDEASLMIRKLINPINKLKRKREPSHEILSPKKELRRESGESTSVNFTETNYTCYDEFEEAGVNDSQTMQNPGVWADHLQVLKLSGYLERSIWLYRYDDPYLKIDDFGIMVPSNDYQIRSSYNIQKESNILPPITLYYIPEAHYEVLKLKDQKNDLQTQKLFEKFSVLIRTNADIYSIVNTLFNLLFTLLKEASDIEEFYLMLSVIPFGEEAKEIKQKREELMNLLLQFKTLIQYLPSTLISILEKNGGKVLVVLLKIFINNTLKNLAPYEEGPLSIMVLLLKDLDTFYTNEESLISSLELNNSTVLNGNSITLKCNPISSQDILDLNTTISSQE